MSRRASVFGEPRIRRTGLFCVGAAPRQRVRAEEGPWDVGEAV